MRFLCVFDRVAQVAIPAQVHPRGLGLSVSMMLISQRYDNLINFYRVYLLVLCNPEMCDCVQLVAAQNIVTKLLSCPAFIGA
jgi:hypothetical protein